MNRLLLILIFLAGTTSLLAQQAQPPVYYFNPEWSADGSKIVFESTRDGKFAVYVINTDGSDLRKLTSGEANDEQARWSRDGRSIVFISDRAGHLQLYLMSADGSNQRRLTTTESLDYRPDFSPKGDWIVFMSRKERASTVHDIYVIRSDGTQRKRLTDESANYAEPVWSPDGKKLVYVRNPIVKKYFKDMSKEDRDRWRDSQEIFVMNSDGSKAKQLTNNQVRDCCARWSADGKLIYFVSDREAGANIYAMKKDGSAVRKVADGSIVHNPGISRDGKYFAYTKEVNKKWGVYLYEIKSGKERLLIGG